MTEVNKSFIKAVIGIFGLILWTYQFIIVFLKLTNVVDWTWFWVLFPIFLQLALLFLVLLFFLFAIFLLYLGKINVKRKVLKQIKDNAEVLSKSEDFEKATSQMTLEERSQINKLLDSVLKNKNQKGKD